MLSSHWPRASVPMHESQQAQKQQRQGEGYPRTRPSILGPRIGLTSHWGQELKRGSFYREFLAPPIPHVESVRVLKAQVEKLPDQVWNR